MSRTGARCKVQGVGRKKFLTTYHLPLTAGFSLIEVTVAVAIIGTMIVAAGALFARIPVDGRAVRDQDLALRVVRNEIENLRAAGYDALPASGPFTDALLVSLPSNTASVAITDFGAKTKQVDVSVSWIPTNGTPRQVTLTTLITQNSGLK